MVYRTNLLFYNASQSFQKGADRDQRSGQPDPHLTPSSARGKASLTFLVREGKTKARLEVELDSEPAPSSSSTPSAPRPRQRRRRQARGAPQQGAQSGSPPPSTQEGEAGHSPRPPRRPLKHLPVPPDGRQAVLTVGRPATPSFASLNMDGSPPSLPPRPPPPPPPSVQTLPNLKLRLWNPGK